MITFEDMQAPKMAGSQKVMEIYFFSRVFCSIPCHLTSQQLLGMCHGERILEPM